MQLLLIITMVVGTAFELDSVIEGNEGREGNSLEHLYFSLLVCFDLIKLLSSEPAYIGLLSRKI